MFYERMTSNTITRGNFYFGIVFSFIPFQNSEFLHVCELKKNPGALKTPGAKKKRKRREKEEKKKRKRRDKEEIKKR